MSGRDVTQKVSSDYGDVLRFDCSCGHEITLNDGDETCKYCGRRYQVNRTLQVLEDHQPKERAPGILRPQPCVTDEYHVRASLSEDGAEDQICLEVTNDEGRVVCIHSYNEYGYSPPLDEYICVDYDDFVREGAKILAGKDARR